MLQNLDADAEFVVGGACGDVLVGVGVDVGVDPQGDVGRLAHLACQLVDDLQLGDRFHVEAADAVLDAQLDFPVGFSHSREGHFFCLESRCESGFHLMPAHQVGA